MPRGYKKLPKEWKDNMKKNHKGMLGKKWSKETREKMKKRTPWNKNTKGLVKISEESRRKISETLKGRIKSPEECLRISESKKGEKHWNWQGGKSFEPYAQGWTDDLRESIRKRDNYTCQMDGCGVHQDELGKKLDVHHIDYDKKNLNPENLISLCRSCHQKTCYNRDYWIIIFKSGGIL